MTLSPAAAAALVTRLDHARAAVAAAAYAAGRDPADITLVAVSKKHPVEAIRTAYEAGQRDFGENYAQELAAKREALADLRDLRWHFIGALQSNKAKLVVPGCVLVHAVDRDSVVEALGRRAVSAGTSVDLLVEVNVGGESTKAGLDPDALIAFVERASAVQGVRVAGLMCIPPPVDDPAAARPAFRRLRELRDGLAPRFPALRLLSMGMSDDFPAAIAEGATHVRIGTAIFGPRPTGGP